MVVLETKLSLDDDVNKGAEKVNGDRESHEGDSMVVMGAAVNKIIGGYGG